MSLRSKSEWSFGRKCVSTSSYRSNCNSHTFISVYRKQTRQKCWVCYHNHYCMQSSLDYYHTSQQNAQSCFADRWKFWVVLAGQVTKVVTGVDRDKSSQICLSVRGCMFFSQQGCGLENLCLSSTSKKTIWLKVVQFALLTPVTGRYVEANKT